MNIEDYREYCLSLGEDVEEKLPFTAFKYAGGVLVFYVNGHMFSFFDCDNFSVITLKFLNNENHQVHLNQRQKAEGIVNDRVVSEFDEVKCLPDSIEELKTQYNCIGKPHNLSPKYWIGVDAKTAPDDLLQELTKHSYEIVKAKYKKHE